MLLSLRRLCPVPLTTVALMIIGILSGEGHAQAQSGSFEPLTLQPDRSYFSQLPFEAIDMATGNLVFSFTDLVLRGNGGMSIGIVRTMNYGGPNGPVWMIGPAVIPIAIEGMDPPASGPWIVGVMTGDRGRRQVLHQTGVDTYVLDNFMRVTLSTRRVELPNGWIATFENTPGVQEAQLQQIHDAFGNSITATWLPRPAGVSTATNISQLQLSGGGDAPRTVFFNYDANGVELQSIQSEGRTWIYGYSAGKLISVAPPAGSPWQFSYGASDLTVTTPNGAILTYQFQMLTDSQGHTHPAVSARSFAAYRDVWPATWTFEYDRNLSPMLSIVNFPEGRHLDFRHQATADPSGGTYWTLVQKSLHRGQTEVSRVDLTYTNCGDGFEPMLSSQTLTQDGRTYTTSFQYNNFATERCDFHRPKQITQTGDLTRTTTLAFHYPSQVYRGDVVSAVTISSGGQSLTTNFTYNAQGFLTSQNTLGHQTQLAPDAAGNVGSVTDANNHTTSFTYQWGTLKDTQTPLYTISRTINSTGTVASETRRGIQTTYSYDGLGRVTTVSAPGIDTTTTFYYADVIVVTQGPTTVTASLDGLGRPWIVTNNVGISATTQFDAEGRVISQTAPSDGSASATDTFGYDDLDRVTSVTHSGGGGVTTTYTGTTVATTDENGHTTTRHVASFAPGDGRLTSVVDPAGQTWQYGYTGLGGLTSVVQPGGTTRSFTYDPWNRLASESHPESATTTYTYDDAGNVITKQDARGTVFTYMYDANNRLTGITGLGSDSVTMAYDESDNRTSVANGAVTSTFAYDAANRLTSRTDVVGGGTFQTAYTYDGRSNLTQVTYPSGRVINYSYDAGNRITQVVDGSGPTYASGLAYHPGGALRSLAFGNGTTETATFDGRYRVSQLTSGPLGLTYGYDPGGNVSSITDVRPERSSAFSYDQLDRLRVVTGWGANEYQYDALGNRIWEATGTVTSTYNSNLRLTQTSGAFGSAAYTYDNAGNLSAAGADTFQYTPFNLLRAATVDGVQTGYTYNGDNERVVRTGPGGATYTVRGLGSQVLAEYEVAGGAFVLVREYVYLGAKLIASIGRAGGAAPAVSVALTTPSAGSTFTSGSPVTLTAQPTVTSGSIARVEFYSNGFWLGEDWAAPYAITLSSLMPAQHGLMARVVTTTGAVASSAVVPITVTAPNGAPVVSLMSPANNTVLGTGRTATLSATATDNEGIAKVEFYRGSFLMATDTTAPYTYDWTDLPNGTYTLTAKAYDVLGATATSAPVTLTVRQIATITVSPASPTAGSAAVVTVDGAAFCTTVNVDFGDGNTQTFMDGGGLPISNTHTWATPGPKTLTAQGLGGACDSQATTTITVLTPPSVTLTSPEAGTNFLPPATIELAATASAAQGSIAYVAFYANGNWLTTDTAAPYGYTWSGVADGTYSLAAVAVDTFGAYAASSSVTVTVGTPPPSTVVGVSVTPNPVAVGQAATITVTGTNPCTMLWMDFGDGDWWIAPISGLPFTTTKTWTTAGNYTVYAAGYYTCSGSATRAVTVTGVPAPTPEPLTEMAATAIDVAAPERVALAVVFGREGHFIPIVRSSRESLTWSNEIDIARQDDASGELRVEASAGPTVSVPDVTVLVDLNGTGSGTVTGGGVTCSGQNVTCSVMAAQGSSVTFMATPQANMIFTGWTGACAGLNPTCTVEAYEHRVAVANFSVSPAMVTRYYHLDALGSVRATTDTGGTVVERHDYRPFGEDTMPLPDPGADPARFLGQQRDSTKLDQFGARYYSMFHGRFSTTDPGHADATLAAPQSWNAYAYARNNPLRYVDSNGLVTFPILPIPVPRPVFRGGVDEPYWPDLGGIGVIGGDLPDFGNGYDGGDTGWGVPPGAPPPTMPPGTPPPPPNTSTAPTQGTAPTQSSGQTSQVAPCGTSGTGIGIGVTGGATGDLGLAFTGATVTGSVGGGLFYDSATGFSAGLFATGAAAANFLGKVAAAPFQSSRPVLFGAYGGVGASAFVTNARSVQQLSGPFTTYSLNVGFGTYKASLQFATSGTIRVLSVGPPYAGASAGFSVTRTVTNTAAQRTGCK